MNKSDIIQLLSREVEAPFPRPQAYRCGYFPEYASGCSALGHYSQIAELVSRTAVVLILIPTSSSLFAVRPAHFTCHHGVSFRG